MVLENFVEMMKEKVTAKTKELQMNCEVHTSVVFKVNYKLQALIIQECDKEISPTIYLNDYHMQYEKGRDVEEIVEEIIQLYKENPIPKQEGNVKSVTNAIMNFNEVKNQIICRLIGVERNREFLETVPHTIVEDMAIIYTVFVGFKQNEMATVTITNSIFAAWKVDKAIMHCIAMENSARLLPCDINGMGDVLAKLGCDEELPAENVPMYIISNQYRVNGAATIMYSRVLRDFSTALGKKNFYVLPSSLHECIFMPEDEVIDVDYLKNMIRDINRTQVAPKDILTDSLYYYDRKLDMLKTI